MLLRRRSVSSFWKYIGLGVCLLCGSALWLRRLGTLVGRGTEGTHKFQIGNQFEARRQHAQQVCQNNELKFRFSDIRRTVKLIQAVTSNHLLVDRRHRLMYCAMPKVGSSFWKRVLKVLDDSNSQKIHLYDMTAMSAHAHIPDSVTLKNVSIDEINAMMNTYTKFTFARDPFSRIFSAYVDKIWVPTTVGLSLVQNFRQLNLTNASQLPCNRKVSFAQFCSLLSDALLLGEVTDTHFTPLITQCHPCLFDFTYIGKMETFMTDTRDILMAVNVSITDITGTVDNVDRTNDLDIIRDITMRSLEYFRLSDIRCLSESEVFHRLWSHFQIRGMLSKHIPLPTDLLLNSVGDSYVSEFTAAIIEAYDRSGPMEDRRRQRDEAMLEAYSSVPKETLKKLAGILADDCALFDYPCQIDRFLNQNISPFYFKNF